MAEWKKVRLGKISKINSLLYNNKEKWSYVNYLDTSNITQNVIADIQYIDLSNEKLPSRAKRKVQKGSIIYSTVRPNQRHYGIIKSQPENFLVSTGFTVIDVDERQADADYIYFLLSQNSVVETLHAIAEQSTSAYPSIKASDIENVEINLPPIYIQRKISSLLNLVTDKMVQNTAINDNLEQQAQALFRSLFIDNADSSWTEGVLSNLGTIVAGGTPSKSKPEYYAEHGIAWITPRDLSINKSKFISHGETDISELGYTKSSATKMPSGTVLFSSRAPIGYIAIASNEVTTNQGFKSVIPNDNIGTVFIYFLLKQLLPTIEGMASGSTFKEISGSGMKSVPVIIPDIETIQNFNKFCNPIFKQQAMLEAENSNLSTMRDILLPKLMSGEVDVSRLDI